MSDLDDADFAIRAPYINRILELEAKVSEQERLLAALSDMVNAPMRLANNDTLYLDGTTVDYLGSKNE